jgi:hypothetical protein
MCARLVGVESTVKSQSIGRGNSAYSVNSTLNAVEIMSRQCIRTE